VAATLTLDGDGDSLLIEIAVNDFGWSLCYLLGEERTYLGAETAGHLLPRLLHAVQDVTRDWPPDGELGGHQDAHQEPVTLTGRIRLSPERRWQWQELLTEALHDYSLNRARQAAITGEIAEVLK